MNDQLCPSFVRQAYAYAGVLHGTGDPCSSGIALVGVFHGEKGLLQSSGTVCDLPVRKDFARFNGVSVTDLPGRDAHLLRQQIDV